MSAKKTPLPLRNDTLLGVCEAIGQDFGFNPLWLRLAFIAPLFFAPVWTIGGYLALGLVVALTRKIAPNRNVDASTMTIDSTAVELPTGSVQEKTLPLAA